MAQRSLPAVSQSTAEEAPFWSEPLAHTCGRAAAWAASGNTRRAILFTSWRTPGAARMKNSMPPLDEKAQSCCCKISCDDSIRAAACRSRGKSVCTSCGRLPGKRHTI
eukprot:scaffold181749_cov31-Tisochrysis_lutea.AAC.3